MTVLLLKRANQRPGLATTHCRVRHGRLTNAALAAWFGACRCTGGKSKPGRARSWWVPLANAEALLTSSGQF
jgi:hypothetical protein